MLVALLACLGGEHDLFVHDRDFDGLCTSTRPE